jgi:hypothetical protein
MEPTQVEPIWIGFCPCLEILDQGEVTESNERSSLLRNRNYYICKKFYGTVLYFENQYNFLH